MIKEFFFQLSPSQLGRRPAHNIDRFAKSRIHYFQYKRRSVFHILARLPGARSFTIGLRYLQASIMSTSQTHPGILKPHGLQQAVNEW